MKTPRRAAPKAAQESPPSDPLSQVEAKEIAHEIVDARKRAGMTQVEIANAMGIAQSAIAKLESGRSLPRLSTLQRFARATSSRLNLSIDPVSSHDIRTASHTMTDTLSRPKFFSDRRQFLGGAAGLAGMLGLYSAKHVTAQEATAAAEEVANYVWVEPEWGDEATQFTVLERGDEVTIVQAVDGNEVVVPSNPERIAALTNEHIPLFELGIIDPIVVIGQWGQISDQESIGEFATAINEAFAYVERVDHYELDMEKVIAHNPDLILMFTADQPEHEVQVLSEATALIGMPYIQSAVPRAKIRDYGDLFGLESEAATILADHEAFVGRAREKISPFINGKKTLMAQIWDGILWAPVSHYGSDNSLHVLGYPFFRELAMTPSSFVEVTAENDQRASAFVTLSMEHYGLIDADYVFYYAPGENTRALYEEFLAHPVVQGTEAYQNNNIFFWNLDEHGSGLTGSRSSVAWIVEQITGEPFE